MSIQSTLADATEIGSKQKSDRTAYLAHLLAQRSGLRTGLPWLQEIREQAAARVQELAIPSTKDEEWRFTDLSALLQTEFQATQWEPSEFGIQPYDLEPFVLPEALNRLVFVDGIFAPELSARISTIGVTIGNLSTIQHEKDLGPRLQTYLAQQQGAAEVFTTLNTASFQDAAIVWVPKNQVVKQPIHLLFVSTTRTATLSHPRCLIVAEASSSLTVIEDYVCLAEGTYFTTPVTEIWIEENAEIHHTRIQRDSATAFHIGKTAVSQARDSRYTCNAISLGAQISRHNLEVYQAGEQTQTTLNGLTIATGEQTADTHSLIAYTKPHSSSQQVHKCIVGDHAHAVFNGRICVPKLAQLTDAKQLSQNLLLSPKARVNTKPQLEIVADNVKCTHGATVSQLESDEVFYLQSRGIDEAMARKLLVYAFAYEVIQQIPIASLRETLSTLVRTQQAKA